MAELADQGAAGFTDDGRPVVAPGLMRRALQYHGITGRRLALHCEEPTLSKDGQMHEGPVSAELGFAGYPSVAESLMVERDLSLAAYENAPLHLLHLSARESVERAPRGAGERRGGDRGGHSAPPLPDGRSGALARPEREDEPSAPGHGRPRGADRGPEGRDDRRRSDRPRPARAAREGGAVRGGAVRRDRPRDRVRGALHGPRRAGARAARDGARADVGGPRPGLRARTRRGSRSARRRTSSCSTRPRPGASRRAASARARPTRGCSARRSRAASG